MTTHDALLPAVVLQRKAVVYVRQSTPQQVQFNLESQRRQYELVEVARRRGFTNIEVIDDDLGRTASGAVERPGFDRLVAALCAGQVGAVLCLDASRLARNGRDWILLWMASQNVHFSYPSNGRTLTSFEWRPIRYRNVISILKNPFYAGVYAYGKSEKRTTIVDGRARKSYGHRKPMGTWEVFIKDHHEGYISWAEYERNQVLLAGNAYGRIGDTKSGRGGRGLLAGLICCARCGRRLSVLYTGRYPRPIYRCEQPNVQLGLRRCLSVAGKRIDETIAAEMLHAVAPMAIEAAEEAERMLRDEDQGRRRIAELELQQAQYDASLAERRYAACDPDNRLIAAQL